MTDTLQTERRVARWRARNGWLWLLPFLYCVVLTARYGYEAPFWDQWWNLQIIQKSFDGDLRLSDFWRLINEHRVFFPNFITVALARISHWNMSYEHATTVFFAFLEFLVLVFMVRRAERATGFKGNAWILPMLGLMVFTYSQWRNWMWGLHLMILMTAFVLVAMVCVLSSLKMNWGRFCFACSLAVCASLSFGTGIMAWPTGAAILAWQARADRRPALLRLGLWILCAVATMLVYFIGYVETPSNEHAWVALGSPIAYLSYVLAYLGAPLFPYQPHLAAGAGILGLVSFVYLGCKVHKQHAGFAEAAMPFWATALLAVTIAFLTGLKGAHEGIDQALSSRYITWSTLFWVAYAAQLYLIALCDRTPTPFRAAAPWVLALSVGIASLYGSYQADERHDAFQIGVRALVSAEDDENLRFLYPDIGQVKQMRPILMRYELTVFRR